MSAVIDTVHDRSVIERSFHAFLRGDQAGMRAHLARDAVWHIAGQGGVSGTHHGADAILALIARMDGETDRSFMPELLEVSGESPLFTLRFRTRAARAGRAMDVGETARVRMAHGKLQEVWLAADEQTCYDDFWS